ncbi:hypothetical protein N7456_003989 [Penicillium angulare]|uniref:Uncharacterized protein n=1 Tax=Penicillium angulare TaxID=116970 RepID=A0A9W9FVT9_9EURO|nr:hypothetical protein N7456_003989 [Penicillium angulare]
MFLPKRSHEGREALERHPTFIRSQLKHYGVDFNEAEFARSNGSAFMKATLQAGMCHLVPRHIAELERQMHEDWLKKLSLNQIFDRPDWVMQTFFLSSGQPDRAKMSTIGTMLFGPGMQQSLDNMIEAVKRITGLQYTTVSRGDGIIIVMGWDRAAVDEGANRLSSEERRSQQGEQQDQENRRASVEVNISSHLESEIDHASPVGIYIVDSHTSDGPDGFPEEELSLTIYETSTPGMLQADFVFDNTEGIMLLSSDKSILKDYLAEAERDEDRIRPSDRSSEKAYKRRLPASSTNRPQKQRRVEPNYPLKYLVKLKSRERGTRMIDYEERNGSITFGDKSFASFRGVADFGPGADYICDVGNQTSFSAKKISDKSRASGQIWNDFSEQQYEYERVARWRRRR